MNFDETIDATGLMCPEPVMMLHKLVRKVASGTVIKVIATDPSTTRDVPNFCNFLGHELVKQTEEGDQFLFYIRRK